jgi:hypothetical protein
MEEETKKILEENLEISKESLKILKGMRRASRLAAAFKILYWLVIIGALAGAYYFLKPYVKSVISVVQEAQQIISDGQKLGNSIKSQNNQSISPDILKNLPPDLLKSIQDFLKTK